MLQYFVYIVCCCTSRIWTLKPSFSNCSLATSAALAATPALEPTIRISSVPSYLPEAKPAALKYLADTSGRGLPSGEMKSTPMPSMPPASSKPRDAGREEVRGHVADQSRRRA